MILVQKIFLRNILLYIALAGILTFAVDHAKVQDQRRRYLLGIFSNGYFKNYKDGVVYCDYMVRHEPNNPRHYANLAECYSALGDQERAAKYRQKFLPQ